MKISKTEFQNTRKQVFFWCCERKKKEKKEKEGREKGEKGGKKKEEKKKKGERKKKRRRRRGREKEEGGKGNKMTGIEDRGVCRGFRALAGTPGPSLKLEYRGRIYAALVGR
jgi:hypothetical protein